MAEAGANLRELMEHMGHASSRAALIYLHSTPDRQRTLADAIAERTRKDTVQSAIEKISADVQRLRELVA